MEEIKIEEKKVEEKKRCPIETCNSSYVYTWKEDPTRAHCFSCGWAGESSLLTTKVVDLQSLPRTSRIPEKNIGTWRYTDLNSKYSYWCLCTANLEIKISKCWDWGPASGNKKWYLNLNCLGFNEFDKCCELTEDLEESKRLAVEKTRAILQMNLLDLPNQ